MNYKTFSIFSFFYIIAIFFFSSIFFSFDAEYFLFFSSLVLFLLVSSTINSFFESLIKARYDVYTKKLKYSSFILSKNFTYASNLEEFFKAYETFIVNCATFFDSSYQDIETLLETEEFFEINQSQTFTKVLHTSSLISSQESQIFITLNFNSFYETLLLFLIQDHWRWKRRARISRTVQFKKPFKTPKKFPAVAWPLKPGEYKAPYVVDL